MLINLRKGIFCMLACAALSPAAAASENQSDDRVRYPAEMAGGTRPVMYINTENAAAIVDKETKIPATMWIEIPENCTQDFEPVASAEEPLELTIKGRGNSSWTESDKKPYKLKLDKKTALLGMPKHKHWALLALALGFPAQFVNTAGFALGREIELGWVPCTCHIEVVLNGEYIGLYDLTESVKIDSNRLDIFEQDEENDDESTIPYGWLVEIDNYDDEFQVQVPWRGDKLMRVTHKSPEVLSDAQREWLTDEFTQLNEIIYSDDPEIAESWAQRIDVASMVKYFIVRELLQDFDGYNGSFYLHRDAPLITDEPDADTDAEDPAEPLWTVGPLWDMGFSDDRVKPCWAFDDERRYGRVYWLPALVRTSAFRTAFDSIWDSFYPTGIENAVAVLKREGELCAEAEAANALRWPQISADTDDKISTLTTAITNNGAWIEQHRDELGATTFSPELAPATSLEVATEPGGTLRLRSAVPTDVTIFTVAGSQVTTLTVFGTVRTTLPRGIYILHASGLTTKVII